MLPKKHLGQHFLKDTGVLSRIVRAIGPRAEDVFLEIGAGDGALSMRLAPRIAHLLAVEIDSDCLPKLRQSLAPFENTTVVHGDMLELDPGELLQPHLAPGIVPRVAGNLPYNQATAIIERLLEARFRFEDMTFLLQLEMAERISARAGSRVYGYFSVYCQHLCRTRLGFRVAPACFTPRPGVISALITLQPRSIQRDPAFEAAFKELAKAAFAHRRKTLANSIRLHPRIGRIAPELLRLAEIDGSRRAEQLSVAEFEHLTRCSLALQPAGGRCRQRSSSKIRLRRNGRAGEWGIDAAVLYFPAKGRKRHE